MVGGKPGTPHLDIEGLSFNLPYEGRVVDMVGRPSILFQPLAEPAFHIIKVERVEYVLHYLIHTKFTNRQN